MALESGLSPQQVDRVLAHWMMDGLYKGRDRLLAQIKEDKAGRCFVTGVSLPVDHQRKHPELVVFAQIMQRMEVELIKPAFGAMRLAKAFTDADIVLFQHDGFTLWVRSRDFRGQVVAMLKRSVQLKAEELGVPTKLAEKL